jgi:hypothetical protein
MWGNNISDIGGTASGTVSKPGGPPMWPVAWDNERMR